jgi:hypothetical protein
MRVGLRNSVVEIQGFTSALTAVYRKWNQSGKRLGGGIGVGSGQGRTSAIGQQETFVVAGVCRRQAAVAGSRHGFTNR